MKPRDILLVALALVASPAACSGSETTAAPTATLAPATTAAPDTTSAPTTTAAPVSTTTGAAPFHAVPKDAVVVSGTAACDFSEEGVSADGDPGSLLVVCEYVMSDPRVSGTYTSDHYRFVAEGPHGAVWQAEVEEITNADGTWRGSTQAAEDQNAIPSGESHFVGEGAYAGLEFHYYFFHADLADKAEVRGWISGGG